jgi:HK97 gp10 family phage protein
MAGFNLFPAIAAGVKPKCQRAIDNTVDAIKDDAQGGAAVRTGFMASNIYSVHTDGGSTYGSSGIGPTGDSYLLEEVKPDNDLQGIVGAAANYSIYVEMGTYKMGAQPFFTPAVYAAGSTLEAGLSLVFTTL